MFDVIIGGNKGAPRISTASLSVVSSPKLDIDQIILDVESAFEEQTFTTHDHYAHNSDGKTHLTIFLKNVGQDNFGMLFSIIGDELDKVGLRVRKFDAPEQEGTVVLRRFAKSWVIYFDPAQSVTGITVWLSLDRALKSAMARYA